MKILYVSGEDYAASSFENAHHGTPVADIIADPIVFVPDSNTVDDDDEDYDDEAGHWNLEVLEFGEIDPAFITFLRNIQDYDDSKHHNFYLETETIGD